MVTRIGGNRRKTRSLQTKQRRQRGKLKLRRYLQEFEAGARVALTAEPSVQAGQYFRRFHGRVGVVQKRVGSCYEVRVADGDKEKRVIIHPVHLRGL